MIDNDLNHSREQICKEIKEFFVKFCIIASENVT